MQTMTNARLQSTWYRLGAIVAVNATEAVLYPFRQRYSCLLALHCFKSWLVVMCTSTRCCNWGCQCNWWFRLDHWHGLEGFSYSWVDHDNSLSSRPDSPTMVIYFEILVTLVGKPRKVLKNIFLYCTANVAVLVNKEPYVPCQFLAYVDGSWKVLVERLICISHV
jgi:hypothetical protein